MQGLKLSLGILAAIVVGCEGSDAYRGTWKATDTRGERLEIVFDASSFTTKDSTGSVSWFDYTQNSVKVDGSVETYGIKLIDGRGYQINFPIADNVGIGLIKDENGNPLYTISKSDYVLYENVYKLH
jgi:hypothetical protein